MCVLCVPSGDPALAQRNHVLQLLALIEHPDALPADMALRLAQEVLALTEAGGTTLQCEAVPLPQADAGTFDRRLSR